MNWAGGWTTTNRFYWTSEAIACTGTMYANQAPANVCSVIEHNLHIENPNTLIAFTIGERFIYEPCENMD